MTNPNPATILVLNDAAQANINWLRDCLAVARGETRYTPSSGYMRLGTYLKYITVETVLSDTPQEERLDTLRRLMNAH